MTPSPSPNSSKGYVAIAAIVCGVLTAFIAVESQRLKASQWAFFGGIAGFCLPYAIAWVSSRIKERDKSIKELRAEIESIKSKFDERLDAIEKQIPILTATVRDNRESVVGNSAAISVAKSEFYSEAISARGEAQTALKLATTAFEQASKASEAVNLALNSGTVVALAQSTTALELEVASMRSQLEKQGVIEGRNKRR